MNKSIDETIWQNARILCWIFLKWQNIVENLEFLSISFKLKLNNQIFIAAENKKKIEYIYQGLIARTKFSCCINVNMELGTKCIHEIKVAYMFVSITNFE